MCQIFDLGILLIGFTLLRLLPESLGLLVIIIMGIASDCVRLILLWHPLSKVDSFLAEVEATVLQVRIFSFSTRVI